MATGGRSTNPGISVALSVAPFLHPRGKTRVKWAILHFQKTRQKRQIEVLPIDLTRLFSLATLTTNPCVGGSNPSGRANEIKGLAEIG